MKADERIAARLTELLEAGDRVLATRREPGQNVIGDARVDQQLSTQWATSAESLLANAFGAESAHYAAFKKHVGGHIGYTDAFRAQGVLKAAAEDLAGGHLFELRQLVEADVFDDFLEQAEHLQTAGYHPAAAVIAGCVLEDALRKLCGKHSIGLSAKPKLDQMNADLAKAGVYTKLTQKRITALADLRNKAAHGEWTDFNAGDVDEMLTSVRRFLEEHYE